MATLKNAVVAYDTISKAWYAASMQDNDGVFIDPVRVSPAIASLLDDIGQGINYITLDTFLAIKRETEGNGAKKGRK